MHLHIQRLSVTEAQPHDLGGGEGAEDSIMKPDPQKALALSL